MNKLTKKIKALEEFAENIEATILEIVAEHEENITAYVTESQLYMEGVRGSDGVEIASYDPYHYTTIERKIEKGQPTDRVTLKDTGDFHKSFKVTVDSEKFAVTAEDWKTDILTWRYGAGILALSDESLHSFKEAFLKPELIKSLRNALNA